MALRNVLSDSGRFYNVQPDNVLFSRHPISTSQQGDRTGVAWPSGGNYMMIIMIVCFHQSIRKRSRIAFLLLAAALAACFMAQPVSNGDCIPEITLKQAIYQALPVAQAWSKQALPAYAVSSDLGDTSPSPRGTGGRRLCWNIVFVKPGTSCNYLVALQGWRVLMGREVRMGLTTAIDIELLALDSSDALQIAREAGLDIPDHDEYHFELMGTPHPIIKVYKGRKSSGFQPLLTLDAASGALL